MHDQASDAHGASETNGPLLSVVIVSYNTRQMTLDCLGTLQGEVAGLDAEVWVVDNASGDGSVEAIRERFPQVRLIANATNVGFGAANNLAFVRARGRYLLLLNSDAFPRQGATARLLRFLAERPDAAAVGPRLLNADGSLQRSCWRFPTPGRSWLEAFCLPGLAPVGSRWDDYRRWAHDSVRAVDYVIGACLLVRREAYEAIGGFDERFFMYAEEADWQRRMRAAGYTVWFCPEAEVMHLGGASGANTPVKIRGAFFDSVDIYCYKHHGMGGLAAMRMGVATNNLLRTPAWALLACLSRRRRAWAAGKLRLSLWLARRSLLHWRVPSVGGVA